MATQKRKFLDFRFFYFIATERFSQKPQNLSVAVNNFIDKRKIFQYDIVEVTKMIKREHYIEQIRPFYESDLIKIITGIRRCGKSVIMEQIIKEISEKTDNVIYLIFEEYCLIGSMMYASSRYPIYFIIVFIEQEECSCLI